MATLAPCIWVPGQAEEAAGFYLAAFRAAGQPAERRGEMRMGAEGALIAVTVALAGQEIILFNPPGEERPSNGISLFLTCRTQAEVDALWDRLLEGGSPICCGWLKDRYGVAWQVVPGAVAEMLRSADAAQAARLMQAIQGMVKLDLPALQRACEG
ncbi:VOC family protein [Paracraurococcus lichenis]|uniref:VOC family protein n=1 Tax=Paracraurococcus lichenis TaxID=3064888 RepID=A0ABT9DX21_9PROT|nr:VOC family protein [Paracraurococcus sp. LOR1-02]MDO9708449.1 VOC family protein [Paracraurococcus sp. LOR1-02]